MAHDDKMQNTGRHLLLIACSQRKRPNTELLPALERYDGNTYRMIRRLRREDQWPYLVDVSILSAEFGLLKADDAIPYYERRMDQTRANELRPMVLAALEKHLNGHQQYASAYIDLGLDYLPAIDGIDKLCKDTPIVFAQGRIGQRLGRLKQWFLDLWYQEPIVPFFVADRPLSLKLLKGLPLRDYPDVRIGIMAHANTTASFQAKLHDYPCEDRTSCDAIGGKACPYNDDIEKCRIRSHILKHTVKMCDSGIFTRQGATLSYEQLFETYERMGVEYGIMIDEFQNPEATLESAKKALRAYKPYKGNFRLVGVAHGRTVDEYMDSYASLKGMGFTHVAVGGLLRRMGNSVRYTQVRDEPFMYQVLDTIRSEYPHDWLFALGCFHPNRLAQFSKRRVWGDYKGWIFRYEKINDTLDHLLEDLGQNDLKHLKSDDSNTLAHLLAKLQQVISFRAKLMGQKKQTHAKFLAASKSVRNCLEWLYQSVREEHHEAATSIEPILTHALPSSTEERQITKAVQLLNEVDQEKGHDLLAKIRATRMHKKKLKTLEGKICVVNNRIPGAIGKMLPKAGAESLPLITKCQEIVRLINVSESEHRAAQIRENITTRILTRLT